MMEMGPVVVPLLLASYGRTIPSLTLILFLGATVNRHLLSAPNP